MSTPSEIEAIQKKLMAIQAVAALLQQLSSAGDYGDWLQGSSAKNLLLLEANKAELVLKQEEIDELEQSAKHSDAIALADERAELAIMEQKVARLITLQAALDIAISAMPAGGDALLDQEIATLINDVSGYELQLKQLQVQTIGRRVTTSTAEKRARLQSLQDGENIEVNELVQIVPLTQQIAELVRAGGPGSDPVVLASLRGEVTRHEYLMKLQNEKQLQARLPKSLDPGDPAFA